MMRVIFFALFVTVLSAISSECLACKYTVRDVGFVDLASAPYRLFIFIPAAKDPAADEVNASIRAALRDTNIRGGVLTFERGAPDAPNVDGPARIRPLAGPSEDIADDALVARIGQSLLTDGELPLGVLVAPDGRLLPITKGDLGTSADEKRHSALTASIARFAAESPLRDRLARELLDVHSAIVVIEGTNGERNKTARGLADRASRRIGDSLDELEKKIEAPPAVVVVSPEEAQSEKVLLWSMGVPGEPDEAHLVILFGRLRKMGEVVTVPGATGDDLASPLYYIGQDCECELDRAAMQGLMAPHLWNVVLEAEAVKKLGFDPGHPIVKVEMSRILAKGPNSGRRNLNAGLGAAEPFAASGFGGYTEIDIESLTSDDEQNAAANNEPSNTEARAIAPDDAAPDPPSTADQPSAGATDAATPVSRASLASAIGWTVAAIAILVVIVSGGVLLLSRGGA